MLRLECLGRLALMRDGQVLAGPAAQRRRLAVLAIVAVARERGVSRDSVLALLWPDSDAEGARGALKQSLYALRRDAAADALVGGVADLRLNPERVTCDLWEFERACDEHRFADAVRAYTGPFLEGVHVSESADFDQWASNQRARLARRFAEAHEVLAEAAEHAGVWKEAAAHWMQLATLAPLDSRVALRHARALATGGDRAGALTALQRHVAHLHDELGIDPQEDVLALVAELQRRRVPGAMPAAKPEALASGSGVAGPLEGADAVPAPRRHVQRVRLALTALALMVSAAAVRPVARWVTAARRAPANTRVAVLPFTYHGDTTLAYLGPGMVSMLVGALDGVGDLRAVDPRAVFRAVSTEEAAQLDPAGLARLAERLNAGVTVDGDIVEVDGRVRITAALTERGGGSARVQRAVAEGPAGEFLHLVDRLAIDMLGSRMGSADVRLSSEAAGTTSSYAALRAFLDGERAMRAGQYPQALDFYRRAVTDDSLFAIAWYRLTQAADWSSRSDLVPDAAARATRLSSRLPFRERTMLAASAAWHDRRGDEAERLLRVVTTQYPEDVAAWYQLGEVLFHENVSRGRSFLEARGPFEQVLALDSNNTEAMVHLMRIAARERRTEAADSLARLALARTPPERSLELRGVRAFLLLDRAAEVSVMRQLRAADPEVTWNVLWRVSTFVRDWDGADRLGAELSSSRNAPWVRARGYYVRAQLALGRGRLRAAWALVDSTAMADPATGLVVRAVVTALPFVPASPRQVTAVRSALERFDPGSVPQGPPWAALRPLIKPYLLGLLALRDSAVGEARNQATVIATAPADTTTGVRQDALVASLEALIAWRSGRARDALDGTGAAQQHRWGEGGGPLAVDALERFVHGLALDALGRSEEALGWLGSMIDRTMESLPLYGPALLRMAEIEERRGNRQAAAAHLREFVKLWAGCDPELRETLDSVRTRLAEIAS